MDTLTPGTLAGAVRGLIAPTLILPIPAHSLTLNSRIDRRDRAKLVVAHHEWARTVAEQLIPAGLRPWFDDDDALILTAQMERARGGQRWDFGAAIEALKPYLDGLEGTVYRRDNIITAARVHWDTRPTGTGLVHLTFMLDAEAED